ncbi:putative PurR-regulated permease PerM [Roseivirga pacifica]|uniref:Predicted PurR-regulated permease PerM n=1 Tax=Roseivirga pacifica TaxID=1267423 RepID=A0A1I0QY69_9BACT|nr:AI-2E family transporter [Roseivirga pacifica]MCO6357404.1 AI-2E family transporter [Roseivirga pacifica]MCO6367832.1 AI-2E family transporter [Roseivirga pacifica]MCO6369637.1 AI-2E family transporter [Roseivirga pacifica]MCO6373491.1 AI-2E family transporter [Roseivirga pacifica]MCO6377204.1 AI-2E family transporter [Roseivirga pacifica]
MKTDLTERNLQSAAYWIIIITGISIFLIYFRSFLEPIVLAMVIWYLIRTARKYIGKLQVNGKYLPLWLQRLMAFLLTLFVLFGIVQVISLNINLISENASKYDENLTVFLSKFKEYDFFGELFPQIEKWIAELDYKSIVSGVFSSVSSTLGNFALVIVYVIFFIFEENYFDQKLNGVFHAQHRRRHVMQTIQRISLAVNKYFTVKTEMSLLTAVISYVVLLILGVDFPVLWAFIIFILNYIPYIGSLVATLLPAIFSVFQFASFWPFVYVLVCVELVQIIVGNYIEPKVMGKSLNLSPLVVIIALSLWGSIWGVLGMILSVPIVSVIIIICAQFPSTKGVAIMLTENGNIEELERDFEDE